MGMQGRATIRGYFFLRRAELSVSVFHICAELWVLIEETSRIMGIFLEKFGKIC